MTCVAPDARITPGCCGLWNDAQAAAWTRIVNHVHGNTPAKIAIQLGHAGPKGATRVPWEGENERLANGGWPLIGASALPWSPKNAVPQALTRQDMDRVCGEFAQAAGRAAECGFDLLELHCAHGYLLSAFICPLTNRRSDEYGGAMQNRLRFPLEVFRAIRAVWPGERPMSVRISAVDWAPGGNAPEDAVAMAQAFRDAGADLIDVSTGQTSTGAAGLRPHVPDALCDQIRTRRASPLAPWAPSPSPITSTASLPPAAPICALGERTADPH